MAKHRKYALLEEVIQAVNQGGWNVLYLDDISEHPFRLRIYSDSESFTIRVYIWNLTHGGGVKRPVNEYRIQITGTRQFIQESNEKTLILGYWEEVGVFAGFDYQKHNGLLGFSPSIQIREENLRKAVQFGFSPCDRGNGEIAIAFRPDFFISYVSLLTELHAVGKSVREVELVDQVVSGELAINDQAVGKLSVQRKLVLQQTIKRLRDSDFTRRILGAYGNRCAFSGIQLKLTDAAHIIPVKSDKSTDETANRIALSAIHHRAYDTGLITFNEKYQVVVNEIKIDALRQNNLDGGLIEFRKGLRPIIHLPPTVSDRPNTQYITEANRFRGWKY